jgi:glutamate 5-kinase
MSLQEQDFNVVLVSSGAITAGMVIKGMSERPNKTDDMSSLQYLSSIGWHHVLNAWSDVIGKDKVGGLLLTNRELGLNKERDEAMRVIYKYLKSGDTAIANENDAIAHDEIAFGDNDTLAAALTIQIANSTLFGNNIRLILLSHVDGVYENPDDPNSVIISRIENIEDYRHLAGDTSDPNGTGGMATKFNAAFVVNKHGIDMWVANGREEDVIIRTLNGEVGTHFTSHK